MSLGPSVAVALYVAALSFASALLCENFINGRSSSCRQPQFVPTLFAEHREDEGVSSRLVQQEQLFEELSRENAETIASLSISERAKRAMLAEVVEDEIFSVTEQMIDLVQRFEAQSDGIEKFEKQVKALKTRNSFLQQQYNDLVSGRPSSLLNTVDSVTNDGDNSRNEQPNPWNEDEFK
jgi:archaellum component FlaC